MSIREEELEKKIEQVKSEKDGMQEQYQRYEELCRRHGELQMELLKVREEKIKDEYKDKILQLGSWLFIPRKDGKYMRIHEDGSQDICKSTILSYLIISEKYIIKERTTDALKDRLILYFNSKLSYIFEKEMDISYAKEQIFKDVNPILKLTDFNWVDKNLINPSFNLTKEDEQAVIDRAILCGGEEEYGVCRDVECCLTCVFNQDKTNRICDLGVVETAGPYFCDYHQLGEYWKSNDKIHIKCNLCIGKIVEGIKLLSPCIRCVPKGFVFPNLCPKKARGVVIDSVPRWNVISEEQFEEHWKIGETLNAKRRIYGIYGDE